MSCQICQSNIILSSNLCLKGTRCNYYVFDEETLSQPCRLFYGDSLYFSDTDIRYTNRPNFVYKVDEGMSKGIRQRETKSQQFSDVVLPFECMHSKIRGISLEDTGAQ